MFLTAVFLFAFTKVEDWDAWLHLSLGRLFWDLKGQPASEPLLFPMQGQPFAYSSWLFGVLSYAVYSLGGYTGLVVAKAGLITSLFALLIADALRPYRRTVITLFVMSAVLFMTRDRFVERPELLMMFFFALSIFSLRAYIVDGKKYLYFLPLLHLLWANCHSSINLMVVPFFAVLAAGGAQVLAQRRGWLFPGVPSPAQMRIILFVFLLSLGASLISPYGLDQFTVGIRFLGQDYYKTTIFELRPPKWPDQPWPFMMAGAVVGSFVLNRRKTSLVSLFLALPLLILSFTAIRFIAVFGIVAGPIVARNLSAWASERRTTTNVENGAVVALLCWLILSTGLHLARIRPFVVEDDGRFGAGVSYRLVPEGALSYMDLRGIQGRIYNPMQWGQYIIWRDFPKRSPFIDGRAYLTQDLIDRFDEAENSAPALDKLAADFGIGVILASYPVKQEGAGSLAVGVWPDPRTWALVYWDDTARVFLRRGTGRDDVIARDEYRAADPLAALAGRLDLHAQRLRDGLFSELRRALNETGSSIASLYLGQASLAAGAYPEALAAFTRIERSAYAAAAYEGESVAYSKLGRTADAIHAGEKAEALQESPGRRYRLALLYAGAGRADEALASLEKAVKLDPGNGSFYSLLIGMYRERGMIDAARTAEEMRDRISRKQAADEQNALAAREYVAGNVDGAIRIYSNAIAVNPGNAGAYCGLGFIKLNQGDLQAALHYEQKALEIDNTMALAYYGSAIAYKKQGDLQNAKRSLHKYLDAEPRGQFARRARKELQAAH
ncbi:MAG: tetratricopeptide repeat protein [Nitrospiraceae bacterium]|nr:tetratricopeptide repeat protein [Nitrospiraceae bacterium]